MRARVTKVDSCRAPPAGLYTMDRRDFTTLPTRDKANVLRMVATADYGNWDNEANYLRVLTEAIRYKRIRGWFVFSVTTPDSSVRKCKRPAGFLGLMPAMPAKRLTFD